MVIPGGQPVGVIHYFVLYRPIANYIQRLECNFQLNLINLSEHKHPHAQWNVNIFYDSVGRVALPPDPIINPLQ